jgi:antitoxin component YwqK of YwqJK toxin-antitoxin module
MKPKKLALIIGILLLILYSVYIHFSYLKYSKNLTKHVVRYDSGMTKERYYTIKDPQGQDVKEGRYIYKFPNGQVQRGCTYKNGKIIGREVFFHENWRIEKETLYDDKGNVIFGIIY